MKITVQSTEKLHRIGVLGRLEQAVDRANLIQQLDQTDGKQKLQLDFYDADTLPVEIIAAIARCLERGIALKIITYHYLLTHTLMRLELPVQPVPVKPQPNRNAQFQALVLAGSANSLDKILQIVEQLPVGDLTVFIAQHVMENQINLLDNLLKARTDYNVIMPQQLTQVQTRTIYVAPPGHHMKVAHGLVYLTRDPAVQFARPSIDVLFNSLAAEYRENLMAVLLCGFGQDGVQGCATLKQAGSCVLIESGADCGNADVLPNAAAATGQFDHVMALPSLVSLIAATVMPDKKEISDRHLELFVNAIQNQYGYDFRGYHYDSLKRRLANMMRSFGISGFPDFQRSLFSDPALFHRMVSEVSVGVSAFFRHPEQFRFMREKIFPYLESFPVIKIWSAGCSTGEEPYSMAILLKELGLLGRSRLFGTDFNAYLIEVAKTGLFPFKALETSRNNYERSGGLARLDDYLEKKSHYAALTEAVRNSTLFHRHSLVDEGIFNEFQLIVCRNVMIYFRPELQSKILQRFARSLHRDGFLVLGPQDGLQHLARAAGFVPYAAGSHVYRLNNGDQNE